MAKNNVGSVTQVLGAVVDVQLEGELPYIQNALHAKNGDATKGSWVVPADRIDGIEPKDFVRADDPVTGERQPVVHRRGTFVFRLSGRDRQQSASYYTPEVLTRFTVSQALEELLDQDGHTTTAEEILGLSVCEPALGSGAFAIEAVRQLAAEYLRRRQDELGERIEPDDYAFELQRVKAHIALHQVHGVDLNATAVELAEVRSGPVGLLRDLQDLHATASLAGTTWGVLRQAAKGCKDRELISVATRCESQNARQRSWLTTHIEQIAAQALLVAR